MWKEWKKKNKRIWTENPTRSSLYFYSKSTCIFILKVRKAIYAIFGMGFFTTNREKHYRSYCQTFGKSTKRLEGTRLLSKYIHDRPKQNENV